MAAMTAQDKRWQTESDARILADANVIRKTPNRLKAAVKEAKNMATDAKKQATAMSTVAKITRSATKKTATKKKK